MEPTYNFYKAYDNQSNSGRVVVNYELKTRHDSGASYEYVDRVFVWYNGDSVLVDLWNFELMGSDGVVRDRIVKDDIIVEKMVEDGVKQIRYSVETPTDKFVMLFSARDRSFRIVENSFEKKTASGAMHTSRRVELPKLGYIQGEV